MALPLLAQGSLFTSAPPEVEKALRERVAGFYQSQVDGKFRMAEEYVAEDTKERYYNQEKNKIRGFEIVRINWDDGFQKATVVSTIDTTIQMRGQNMPASAPMSTRWKLENGKWCYYVDLVGYGKETPFGRMHPGPGNKPGLSVDEMLKNPNVVLNQVKFSKEKALLKSFAKSQDSVLISNGMPGGITLVVGVESLPGLTWKVDKTELGAGESAKLEFFFDPKDPSPKPTVRATIRIEPFSRSFIVPVEFDIPEEVKQKLPKK
jgi:hypothetical protein